MMKIRWHNAHKVVRTKVDTQTWTGQKSRLEPGIGMGLRQEISALGQEGRARNWSSCGGECSVLCVNLWCVLFFILCVGICKLCLCVWGCDTDYQLLKEVDTFICMWIRMHISFWRGSEETGIITLSPSVVQKSLPTKLRENKHRERGLGFRRFLTCEAHNLTAIPSDSALA